MKFLNSMRAAVRTCTNWKRNTQNCRSRCIRPTKLQLMWTPLVLN